MAVDQDQIDRRRRARRRAGPAVAVSIAVHLAVFLAIGLIVPKPAFQFIPPEKPITLTLLPPMPRSQTHRARTAQASAPPVPLPNRVIQLPLPRVHTSAAPPRAVKPSPVPAPPAPAPGTPAAGKPGTSVAPGPLPADESPRGVQALLRRSVGCDVEDAVQLTREEKEACAKRFGDMAKKASPFSAIPDDKRGAYSVQAAADERRRAAREGPTGQPVVACDGPGSNFGVGCLPESAIHHFKQH